MCYLCEAKGLTGPKYRETQKAIQAGIRAWRLAGDGHVPHYRLRGDWTKLPTKKMWKAVTP